jgi:hypothetical protein
MTDRRRIVAIVGGISLLALALRLYGLGWGLPAVYEEAYPFKKSWDMWGWGPSRHLDFNPHFFNYPTFYFYVQFLGQGLLFLILKLRGVIHSALDFRVLYALDKTSFYWMGRGISALCGTLTVPVTFWLGRRAAGARAGVAAALLVAVNQVHIVKSQAIEVDVPLTLLATVCCLFSLRILAAPRRRDYLLAALAGGLATSTKYNGALLALPILVAHLGAWWRARRERQAAERAAAPKSAGAVRRARGRLAMASADGATWVNLGAAAVLFTVSFFATSPYVLLDRADFWVGFNYERLHMQIGHFGLDSTPPLLYYARVMTGSLMGWPLTLLAGAGMLWALVVRRMGWAMVLAIFPVVYVTLISSWSMKAERYILPLLPLAAVFAAAFLVMLCDRLRSRHAMLPAAALAASVLVLAAPSLLAYERDLARLHGDTRTLARQWIETHMPAGSFIVCESYGPEPFGVIDFQNLEADVRERITKQAPDLKLYALLAMPMYQVMSENTALFYDPKLYDNVADLWVTSSSVVSRYRKNPGLYAAQCSFYDSLDAHWNKLREFGPQDGSGPRITIYGNPRVKTPFSARRPAQPPAAPPIIDDLVPGTFSGFFERFGFLYEIYDFQAAAGQVYAMGLRYPDQPAEGRRPLALGLVRTALARGDGALALTIAEEMQGRSTSRSEANFWKSLHDEVVGAMRRGTPAAGKP